jgi:hypothetical protein
MKKILFPAFAGDVASVLGEGTLNASKAYSWRQTTRQSSVVSGQSSVIGVWPSMVVCVGAGAAAAGRSTTTPSNVFFEILSGLVIWYPPPPDS